MHVIYVTELRTLIEQYFELYDIVEIKDFLVCNLVPDNLE